MAQFRTVSDICDEVLQKSGEPTNGNSPYEALVLTYINKTHQAVVGGGSIFNLKVDEAWNWARAKNPIVLELQPAFTGTVTVTNGDINITFAEAPTYSIQGWYFQLKGLKTVYRLTEHSTGINSAVLDSPMLDPSGTYTFRAFKLDYEISPQYIYVDSRTDRIDFLEAAGTPLTASLTHGSYIPSTFIDHVVSRLNATGTNGTYTGSYDPVLKTFSLTSSLSGGKIFSLLGATGSNKRRSGLPLLGLDHIDHTGAGTYESAYIINGISRMIEPFKVFTLETNSPFITSTDPVQMEEEYPLAITDEKIPTRFCHIAEDNEGAITVRFNAYPRDKTKLTIDWVPIPLDLQDNAASFPLIPRKDIDVLIHGASAYILFDKEDSKWEGMLNLTRAGLEAMEKKNRSELFRTGANFAQIIPRADYVQRQRKLRYGYTVDGGATPASVNETAQQMIKVTKTYADFQTGSTTNTINVRSLPTNRTLFALIIKHSIAFSGGDISALTLSVGITGDTTKFIASFDVFQAVSASAQDSVLLLFYPATATTITVTATATGDNLSALTAGSVDLYFQETIVE